jgi:hypothetical protein
MFNAQRPQFGAIWCNLVQFRAMDCSPVAVELHQLAANCASFHRAAGLGAGLGVALIRKFHFD